MMIYFLSSASSSINFLIFRDIKRFHFSIFKTSPPAPLLPIAIGMERGDQRSWRACSITYAKFSAFYCFNLNEAISFASIHEPRNFGSLLRRTSA